MSLVSATPLFESAIAEGYSLGYFESWNLESLLGVLDAAEETRSPVIIGFSGDFLTLPDRITRERVKWYSGLGVAAAKAASVPCVLFFNESPFDGAVREAIDSGFTMVMLADPAAPHDQYMKRVRDVVLHAHANGVAVEGEVGELPSGAHGETDSSHAELTDPEAAAEFVKSTGIDLLAISAGNTHIMLEGTSGLDVDRIAAIRERVDVPLSLHGGSGIPKDRLREAIRLGIAKVAYGTYVKQRYLAALRRALGSAEVNPHKLLGMGGAEDLMVIGRLAVRDAVLENMEVLGCCGKA